MGTPLAQRLVYLIPPWGCPRPAPTAIRQAENVCRRLRMELIRPSLVSALEMGGVVIVYRREGVRVEAICLNTGDSFEIVDP